MGSCGTREYSRPVSGLSFGQSSPGEFPWTCLLLNQNNDFIGTCAVIPSNFRNDNSQGTRKVITAAHKLKALGETDLLKVRVGEWDASGFNPPEVQTHQEYTVTRILKHPQFNPRRLSNDIALLTLDRNIDLNHPTSTPPAFPAVIISSIIFSAMGRELCAGLQDGEKMKKVVTSSSFRERLSFLLSLRPSVKLDLLEDSREAVFPWTP